MNWYKLKFASPMQNKHNYEHYTDILHPEREYDKKSITLWFIDKDMKIHTTNDYNYHMDWTEYKNYQFDEPFMSVGRYSKRDKTVSASLSFPPMSPSREVYIFEQIEKILDKTFNNPKILTF